MWYFETRTIRAALHSITNEERHVFFIVEHPRPLDGSRDRRTRVILNDAGDRLRGVSQQTHDVILLRIVRTFRPDTSNTGSGKPTRLRPLPVGIPRETLGAPRGGGGVSTPFAE